MTIKSRILDWAGMTIRCKNIIVGAEKSNTTNDVDTSATLKGGSLTLTFPTGAATAAGGDAATAGADVVIPVDINGTTYYILATAANA